MGFGTYCEVPMKVNFETAVRTALKLCEQPFAASITASSFAGLSARKPEWPMKVNIETAVRTGLKLGEQPIRRLYHRLEFCWVECKETRTRSWDCPLDSGVDDQITFLQAPIYTVAQCSH